MNRHSVLIMSLLSCCTAAARADEITTGSGASFRDVHIQAIDSGMLRFVDSYGRTRTQPLDDAPRITFDRWAAFNEAEALRRAGRDKAAAEAYAALLKNVSTASASPVCHHADQLVRARLIQSLDAYGQFDEAVAQFIALTRQWGQAAGAFTPRNLPNRYSQLRRPAIEALHQAIEQIGDVAATAPLRALLDELEQTPEQRSRSLAAQKAARTAELRLRRVGQNIEAGDVEPTLPMIDHALRTEPFGELAPWLYWQGRAIEALAKTDADVLDAAVAYMRVVVFFPNDEHVPECLVHTAAIHKRLGLTRQAERLLREAMRKSDDAAFIARCQAMLDDDSQ
jgi:tetratricopeptide (TPR) repeat protein